MFKNPQVFAKTKTPLNFIRDALMNALGHLNHLKKVLILFS